MATIKVTNGDQKLLNRLQGGTISAVHGNSSAGQGWRPVCKGVYLGNECKSSEQAAINAGKQFLNDLEQRIKGQQKSLKPKTQTRRKVKENEL